MGLRSRFGRLLRHVRQTSRLVELRLSRLRCGKAPRDRLEYLLGMVAQLEGDISCAAGSNVAAKDSHSARIASMLAGINSDSRMAS